MWGALSAIDNRTPLSRCLVPLRVMGRNSLLIVVLLTLLPLSMLSHVVIQADFSRWLAGAAPIVRAAIEFAIIYLPACALYRFNRFFTV